MLANTTRNRTDEFLIHSTWTHTATWITTTYHSPSEKSLLTLWIKSNGFITRPASINVLRQFEVAHGKVEVSREEKSFPLLRVFTVQRLLGLEVVDDPLVIAHCQLVLARLQQKHAIHDRFAVEGSALNCNNYSYSKPQLRTKFAERAFSFAGPAEWNCLPSDLRLTTNTNSFVLACSIQIRVDIITVNFSL